MMVPSGHGKPESLIGSTLTPQQALQLVFPNASLLAELERMRINAGVRIKGTLAGKRRSSSLGGSQEFADYRPYSPGDDIRRIDWNVYGRTGKAFMRQYWDEQELHVHLYVDVSRSMAFGDEEENKAYYALRLAACLGYIGLSGDDRVSMQLFRDRIIGELPPLHGRAASAKLFQFVAETIRQTKEEPPANESILDTTDMASPFRASAVLPRRAGTTWIFTDAMFEQGIHEALVTFIAARQHVVLVHLLSQDEVEPNLSGELNLIDSERGTGKEVAIGHKLLKEYSEAVASFQHELKRICAELGAVYLFVNTDTPLEETIRQTFLSADVLNK